MSHNKRRVYPQAQYQQQAVPEPQQLQQQSIPYGGAMGQLMSPKVSSPMGSISGQAGGPMTPNMNMPVGQQRVFTPAQQQLAQQIDQAAHATSQMHISDPMLSQQQGLPMGQPGQASPMGMPMQPQQSGMPMHMPMSAAQQHMPGGKQLNQLYPIDLLTEIPPPIRDLSLPPPPLIIPPEKIVVPSDSANANAEYVRCTLNAVPRTHSLLKKTKLPLALVIRPYQTINDDDSQPPLNEDGLIVRCRRCRSYLNPFVTIIDHGRKWRCNFCRLTNDFPQHFDHAMDGTQLDRFQKNELRYGVMEYIAPKEYTVRQPPPSTYCFIIDVSQNAIKNGFVATATRTLLESLDSIPNRDQRTRISILCVDNSIHYFSIPEDSESIDLNENENGNEENGDSVPKRTPLNISMMDVGDLDEPFLPKPRSMVVNLKDCRKNIEKLLIEIPNIFQNSIMNSFALGPSLKSAFNLIKNIGGKIIVLSSTLPNKGIGKLQRRNESGVANTPKETPQLLSCQDAFYKTFTIECSKAQITVDTFLASEEYMDVATLSNLGRFTGGQTHFYPGFNASSINDVIKFTKEFSKYLSMDMSMETVMRARGSTGIRMNSFYGHFFNRSSDLCAFSTMPRDQSYVFELQLDEKIMTENAHVQIAVLLSLNTGQRRIRVITVALPVTDSVHSVFASADQLAMTDYYAQKAIQKAFDSSLQDARNFINNSVQDILTVYKRDAVVSNTAGGAPLRLCSNLRMFPLLMHSLTKNMAFRNAIVPSDHRAIALNNLESWPLQFFIKNIYPNVYSLHDMPDDIGLVDPTTGEIKLPQPMNATATLFERYGLYLIDNGNELFLWVGGDAVHELIMDVFGNQDIYQIPIGKEELPILENSEFNERLRNIISKVRENNHVITYQSLYIVRGSSINEPISHAQARDLSSLRLWVASYLVEDKNMNTEGYREFLSGMKNRISK
ncbi:hypothetical protein TBLA_0G02480 [Henningerozyma blattae CBS 6284]|uniref:Protein transport protein SEC24 n=1 Tax=Henningerozyma blattae (strain ATCC 34711 / CBS 6284 / DSM 70876 / NBRC 10599 / NRRL Y-10934 / UCD 77-7) TaxID=1071380 RepID=I2H735_HENB6|nr:hypothetical protein TBLA_0G02480 [Tetrapisispora blattae CBS 6284]CCH62187.1 hypothetical protein TBLA_0G02480 [Tetrapisispora blattae CBS 6284]